MADAEAQRQAKARGEALRAELLAMLGAGPQTAAELLPQVATDNVSLSEVAFQLDRLEDEGRTLGAQGEPYRLR